MYDGFGKAIPGMLDLDGTDGGLRRKGPGQAMVDDYTGGGFDTPIFIGKRQLKVSAKTMKNLYCTATGFAVTAWGAIELYHNVRAGFAWWKFWDRSDYNMHKRYARNAHDWNRKADAGNNWAKNYESRFATLLGTGVKENDSFGNGCTQPAAKRQFREKR